jgi:hypothetical protein
MTTPTLAVTGAHGHRVYTWAGREYPSVTAIIKGGVPAPFLPGWAAKAEAEYAVANLDRLPCCPSARPSVRSSRPRGRPATRRPASAT